MERRMREISKRMKNKWMSWGVVKGVIMRGFEKIMKKVNIRWEVNLHQ
ncbi:MAG: hypothetical protein SBU_001577 [Candidatus Syntrophoarchaeum butanivorans]|uniref:Uncharacterized protein n=1 Tax=Candidatus Syntropharchaeum butanivorans TaxID=1839936 RepID=A0A1F2P2T0_9EURY|nr:MAG: hypothetical protein SBU_001577 [Candidatus Syntrophoarchaeum butanivorans]